MEEFSMSENEKKVKQDKGLGGWAFYPFLILLAIVIARIIYNAAIGVPQQGNSFAITAVVLVSAFSSLLVGRGKIRDRVDAFTHGMAKPGAMMMVFIFMLAGAFTAVSSEMGGVASLSNFCLHFIPKNMIYAGILFTTAIIATSIGTSVGSITAMAPIALGLASQAGLNPVIAVSAAIGGACLGDNISFVSDTTIAATQGVGCEMKDKFKFNIRIVLPAFIVAMIVYIILGINSDAAAVEIGEYNVIKMLPYFYIIIAAIAGMNIMMCLATGILFSGIIGICYGDLTIISFMGCLGSGMTKVHATLLAALLVLGIMGVVEYNGGIEWLINKLTKNIKSAKGAQYSIAALSFLLGALIRSTSAIIVAAPLAKDIGDAHGIDPRRTASLMDIFATAQNGFIFWAGLLMDAAVLTEIDSTSFIPYAIYPLCVIIMAVLSIQFNLFQKKDKTEKKAKKAKQAA